MARKGDGIFKRGKVWRLDCIINGVRYQGQLGKGITREVALQLATDEKARIYRGERGMMVKQKEIPFEKALDEFLAAKKGHIRDNTYRSYETCLDALKEHYKGKNLGDVTAFSLEAYKKTRKEQPVQFNRELGTLKTLFNWFIDNDRFNGNNPCRKVKKFKESIGRERYLEPEEEVRLLEKCSESLKTILLCGIDAGLRIPSETLWLKKSEVNFTRNEVLVRAEVAKNGKDETVPLTPRLRDALKRIMQSNPESEYVFTKPDGQPYKTIQNILRTAAKRAGIPDISPHVMRHTFATRLDKSGASLREIQELGRWADIRMVQRYSNVSERSKREAIKRLAGNSPQVFPSAQEPNVIPITSKIAVNGSGNNS